MHGALASSVTLPSADACQACQNDVLRASDASIMVEGIMIAVCIKQGCQLGLICACCACALQMCLSTQDLEPPLTHNCSRHNGQRQYSNRRKQRAMLQQQTRSQASLLEHQQPL
jgi:hypothetical protein